MEYKIVEESPVSRKIEITASPEEVAAAIGGAIALNRNSVELPGYRKGKVPDEIIEKRFHDAIYNEARENLINVHLNEIAQKLDAEPLEGFILHGDDEALEKGKPFVYSAEFETMPKFDLPNYEGLEVEQEKTVSDEKELARIFERLLADNAELVPLETFDPPKEGQIAVIDFEAFQNDKPVKDLKSANFELELGKGSALPEFEKLVMGIPVGHTGEGNVHFPEDFFVEALAGQDLKMKITVHGVKEKKIPQLDDEFAKKLGFSSAENVRELITKSYIHNIEKMNKGVAEYKLLQQLLKQTDYPLPPGLVNSQAQILLGEEGYRLEQQGKSLAATGKKPAELLEALRPRAEELARTRVLLMAIAKKEKLEVSQEEVYREVLENSIRKGENYEDNLQKLERSGFIFQIRDQMLCDKAMDLIYAKANVKMIEPGEKKEGTPESAAEVADGAGASAQEAAKAAAERADQADAASCEAKAGSDGEAGKEASE